MKPFFHIMTALTVILLCFGCSSSAEDEPVSNNRHNRIHELISEFYNTIHPETKAGTVNFSITDISTATYHNSHRPTRTGITEVESEYDIHTVNYCCPVKL